jgi:hypothetical protein
VPRRAAFRVLASLCVLAVALRIAGIDYLLPEVMNRDGHVLVRQVEFFRTHAPQAGDPAWWYSSYPHLLARLAAWLPETTPPHAGPLSIEEHLALARAPWIQLRVLSVALALLAIPGTYLLARRFLDRGGALFAATLLATSLHHVVLSIQEKPHAASATFVLLAILAALRLRRKPDLASYLGCGAALALSVGSLHSGAAALFPIAAAFVLRDRSRVRASPWWILSAVGLAAIAVRMLYPFFFEGLRDPAPQDLPAAGPDAAGFAGKLVAAFHGAPMGRILGAITALDPLLVSLGALGVVGLVVAIPRARSRPGARSDLLVLLAFAAPCLIVFALLQRTLVRFFLPLYPLLACAGGYAFVRVRNVLAGRLTGARSRSVASSALACALVLVPLVPAAHFACLRCRPGPLREAADWVAANVDPEETVVVVPNVDLGLLPTADAIALNASPPWRTIWTEYLARAPEGVLSGVRRSILIEPGQRPGSRTDLLEDPLSYLGRYRARFLVLDLSGGGEALLGGRAERVARFSPARVDGAGERGIVLFGTGFDPLAPSALRLLRMRALGTSVEIHRLP